MGCHLRRAGQPADEERAHQLGERAPLDALDRVDPDGADLGEVEGGGGIVEEGGDLLADGAHAEPGEIELRAVGGDHLLEHRGGPGGERGLVDGAVGVALDVLELLQLHVTEALPKDGLKFRQEERRHAAVEVLGGGGAEGHLDILTADGRFALLRHEALRVDGGADFRVVAVGVGTRGGKGGRGTWGAP
jgi:hypothetical protein